MARKKSTPKPTTSKQLKDTERRLKAHAENLLKSEEWKQRFDEAIAGRDLALEIAGVDDLELAIDFLAGELGVDPRPLKLRDLVNRTIGRRLAVQRDAEVFREALQPKQKTATNNVEKCIAKLRIAIKEHGSDAKPYTLVKGMNRKDGRKALRLLEKKGEYSGFTR